MRTAYQILKQSVAETAETDRIIRASRAATAGRERTAPIDDCHHGVKEAACNNCRPLLLARAAMVTVLWCVGGTYGCLNQITSETAARVRQEAHVATANPDRAGVGWDGVRSRQWRATGQAFGWQSRGLG